MHAVLDRIENGIAVLLIEEKNAEYNIPAEQLPTDSEEGTWFNVEVVADQLRIINIDEQKTKQATDNTMSLMKKLRAKQSKSKFSTD